MDESQTKEEGKNEGNGDRNTKSHSSERLDIAGRRKNGERKKWREEIEVMKTFWVKKRVRGISFSSLSISFILLFPSSFFSLSLFLNIFSHPSLIFTFFFLPLFFLDLTFNRASNDSIPCISGTHSFCRWGGQE